MKIILSLAVSALLFLSACTTEDAYTGERKVSKATIGAGLGAAGGALIGAITGDNADERRKRAVIGAGIGGLAGGGIGLYMDKQEAELRDQLRGSGVSVTRNGNNIILNMPGNITFASGKSSIRSEFYNTLDSVALVLKKFEKTYVNVEGHTDSDGSHSFNQSLSEERANTVSQYLIGNGVQYARLNSVGYGESQPIATNSTSQGKSLNRRVEINLVPIEQN